MRIHCTFQRGRSEFRMDIDEMDETTQGARAVIMQTLVLQPTAIDDAMAVSKSMPMP